MHGEALATVDGTHEDRARLLREAFDRAFAEAPAAALSEQVDLIGVRLGGDGFALRLVQTAGLFAGRKVTPVPTAVVELRGIAGLRGSIVPVYDLGMLIGYPPAAELRWLILAREAAVAFAFDVFDGQMRIGSDAIVAQQGSARSHVREVARSGDSARPIIDLASIITAIGRQAAGASSRKEL